MTTFRKFLLEGGVKNRIFQHHYYNEVGLYQVKNITDDEVSFSLYHTSGEPWVRHSGLSLLSCLDDEEATEKQVINVQNSDKTPYEFARTMEQIFGVNKGV